MTKEELANNLNGREYGSELISKDEEKQAKENGLVVIHGESDDLLEFRGAIDDEIGAWRGKTVMITSEGKFPEYRNDTPCDCDDRERCPLFNDWFSQQAVFRVFAEWCPKEPECSWLITASIPCSSFEIMEDGELYCRGIVIDLKEAKSVLEGLLK